MHSILTKNITSLQSRFHYRLICWGILLLLFTKTSLSQSIFFNKVQPPPGKSFLHITGMVQDQKGYMWLASKNGLFRYDGYQMIQYRNNPLDINSLGSDMLETICVDKTGIIWIGTFASGLDRFDPGTGRFTHFRHKPTDPSSVNSDSIQALCADRDGTLWIGANGLDRFNPGPNTFTHYKNKPDDPTSLSCNEVRAIYEDKQGVLWIGTGSVYTSLGRDPSIGGLNRMNKANGTFTTFSHDASNPHSLINNKVRAIFEDSKGNFWVGTAGDGLHIMNRSTGSFDRYSYDPGNRSGGTAGDYPYDPQNPRKLSRPPLKKINAFDHITFITEDVTGGIWIGTAESGINYYNTKNGGITHFESGADTAGSFHDYTAWWACRSRDGVLWISTTHGDLYRINSLEGSIPFYPIQNNSVSSLYLAPDKTTWVGTVRDGLFHRDASGKLLKKYSNEPDNSNSLSGNDISCMTMDNEGKMWVGTFGSGLNQLNIINDKEICIRYSNDRDNSQSICDNTVLTLYDDRGKYLWIGTVRGLSRLDKQSGQARNYLFYPDDKEDITRDVIASILKDSHSLWWAGCWNRGGIQQFDPETGKSKTYLAGASIARILEDHSGTLWAAGAEGLYRFNRKLDLFQQFEDPAFLTEVNLIGNLLEDNKGNIWMTTPSGFLRLNAERNETTLFGKSYGITGNDFFNLSGYKDPDGKLYFGYQSGYYAFFPDDLARGMRAPEIIISDFRVDNQSIVPSLDGILKEPISATTKIRLNYNQNLFSFEFAGIDYSNPEDNRHLFMLENYDEKWNLAGSERKATYFNVPPGKYIFRVKVVNSYGVWTTKNIEVIITPPWWTRWWFRIGVVLIIAGLFYTIIRWRVRQKFDRQLERSEKDKQLAELRQKTGELEMRALRAQMNPHFVFNSLNAINRFILQNNKTQASEYLTKFSRLVRMILQNSQSTLITLESELDSLKLYLELEALRFDNRFEYKVTVPKDLDIEILKVPPLIIQPYAENAIWHGLMHKEEKGFLGIDIRQEENHLFITIKDDGVGRKQSAARTDKSAMKHKSMGLKITADRIANLQRTAAETSPVVINDLEHADGTAAGTEVIIKIPVIYD